MTTNEKTMTVREYHLSVIKFLGDNEDAAAVIEYAEAAIAKMDETNAKRKGKQTKAAIEKAAANAPLLDALEAALTDEPKTATDLMGLIDAKVQKTSYLLRQLVAAKKATAHDVKVKGKGTQKGYTKFIED